MEKRKFFPQKRLYNLKMLHYGIVVSIHIIDLKTEMCHIELSLSLGQDQTNSKNHNSLKTYNRIM